MEEWKHFCAKVAKSFKNQCETEGARSHQSLWKPFRFWFVSLNFWEGGFGATVSHLMVPELEQRSARPARSAGRKNESTSILFSQKWKIGHGRDLGPDLVSAEGECYRGPTPKRKHL